MDSVHELRSEPEAARVDWNEVANDGDWTPEQLLAGLNWASLLERAAEQLRFELVGAGGASWMRVSGFDPRGCPSDGKEAEGHPADKIMRSGPAGRFCVYGPPRRP